MEGGFPTSIISFMEYMRTSSKLSATCSTTRLSSPFPFSGIHQSEMWTGAK
jgi:hypothetical protein